MDAHQDHLDTASILNVDPDQLLWVGQGARTRGLYRPRPGVKHRFGERSVLVKLYRGSTALPYRRFHGELFSRLPAGVQAARLQRSIEAGLHQMRAPYAVLEYIPGQTLRERLRAPWTVADARKALKSLFFDIWLPVWAAQLRFKDCHLGNFIVAEDGRLVMIDVEQVRKSAAELLETPQRWSQRDRHEARALRQVKNLLINTLAPAGVASKAALNREVDLVQLLQHLSALGRAEPGAGQSQARAAVSEVLDSLTSS